MRTGLAQVVPAFVDHVTMTASSCVPDWKRRQDTYTVPLVGLIAICAFWFSRWPMLRFFGALQVCPQLVDRESMICDCSADPLPVKAL